MNSTSADTAATSGRRRSLATRLTWLTLLMVVLALTAVGTGLIFIAERTQREAMFRLQQQRAERVAQLISGYMTEAKGRLRFFLEYEPLALLTPARQHLALENLLIGSLPFYSQLSLLDRKGRETAKVSRFHTFLPEELASLDQEPAFTAAIRGEPYIGPIDFLEDTGLLSLQISLPLKAVPTEITGVVIAEINISHLWQAVAAVEIGRTGYAYLVDRRGRFIAYQKPAEVLQRYGEDMRSKPPVAAFGGRQRESVGGLEAYRGLLGETVIGVYAPIGGTDWAVVVEQSVREAYAGIAEMKRYLFWLMGVCVLLVGGMTFLAARHLIYPVRALTIAAQRFGSGDLDADFVTVKRPDEVGVLSHTFNTMQRQLRELYAGLKQKVAELEEAHRALQKSEANYRLLIENQSDLVVKIDPDGRFLFVSPSYCALFDKTENELIGRHFLPLVHQEDREKTARAMEKLYQPPYSAYFEQRAMTRFGWRWLAWSDNAVLDRSGNITAIIGMGRDITDRVNAETALKKSEERFRTLVEQSPLGIAIISSSGRYQYVNSRFQEMFGYSLEDIPTGADWFQKAFPDPAYRQKVIRRWNDDLMKTGIGRSRPRIFQVTCGDGTRKEIHFRPVTLENQDQFVIYEDITERKRFERQLQQSQKFEAIGTLAGGIAHDFNNLLMGIQGCASLVAADGNLSPSDMEHIEAIESYVRSATDLTKQLLGIARGGKYAVKPVDISALMRESAAMFGRTRKEIRIHTKTWDRPLVVEADKRQMEQVLLNMYINAWQAMPGGGDLYLESAETELDQTTNGIQVAGPTRFARISVTDTGVGMDAGVRQRIFDPFFTTKEKGRGTGLGLASAYGIIQNHDGMITVYSEPGHGSTFNIYLPLSDREVGNQEGAKRGLVSGTGTVLLVDDETMIVNVAKAMLEKLGYRVLTANSGQAAVKQLAEQGESIDLVILDLIMPGMDGGETFDRIREQQPKMPILLSSGYSINGQAATIMARGADGFIQKPFNLAALSEKIGGVLGNAAVHREPENFNLQSRRKR